MGAALVFGRRGVIDLERIPRPRGSTGIYAPDGSLDQTVLDRYRALFTDGSASFARLRGLGLGRVPRRQFESLFRICRQLNGGDTVTLEQFNALYDGTLLYQAAEQIARGR